MDFIDGWVEAGITGWDPAQISNDLLAIHKKHGKKLAINGGWDSSGVVSRLDVTDEMLIHEVRNWCDKYLSVGTFGFMGNVMGRLGDPEIARKNEIIQKEFLEYSKKFF